MLTDPMIPMVSLMANLNDIERLADPNVVKVVVDNDNFALYFSRSPIPFHRDGKESGSNWKKHIGLYAFRRNFLLKYAAMEPTKLEQLEKLEQLRALENGYKIKMVEVEDHSIGVDTPEDFEMVRMILSGGSF
jgi:3-deoxy-manno-octulosonate cytidylyltransferase (CMP-KDO synthetase)